MAEFTAFVQDLMILPISRLGIGVGGIDIGTREITMRYDEMCFIGWYYAVRIYIPLPSLAGEKRLPMVVGKPVVTIRRLHAMAARLGRRICETNKHKKEQ